jgi:hypothetical protein
MAQLGLVTRWPEDQPGDQAGYVHDYDDSWHLDVPLDDGTTWRVETERAHTEEDTGAHLTPRTCPTTDSHDTPPPRRRYHPAVSRP